MPDDQVLSEFQSRPSELSSNLPDRMDNAIGEASSGIGHMVSELVRRSLRTSVGDIDGMLKGFAEEQVDVAVEKQMPALTESAQTVAESTTKKAIAGTVDQLTSEIKSAEERAASKTEEIGRKLEDDLNTSKEHLDATSRDLKALREGAKATWQKLLAEFEELNRTNEGMRQELAGMRTLSDAQQQRISELESQNSQLDERLAELERPRGLKGLWSKIKGGRKKKTLENE